MKAYLVRSAVNQQLIGFFVARNPDELADLLDEEMDPHLAEFRTVDSGGVFFPDVAPPIPIGNDDEDEDDDEPEEFKMDGCSLSEIWYEAVREDGRWKPVPHSPTCDAINEHFERERKIMKGEEEGKVARLSRRRKLKEPVL